MTQPKPIRVASAALAVAGILSACAVDPYASADARITAQVEKAIAQHPDLGPPNQIYVDTRGRTVYLTGTVYDDLGAANAKDVAQNVPGVSGVVSSVGVTGGD